MTRTLWRAGALAEDAAERADREGASSARRLVSARRAGLAALALAGLVVAGCGSGDKGSGGGSTAASTSQHDRKIVVGYSDPVGSNQAQQAVYRAQKEAAKQLGWEIVHLDANLSPSKQLSDIDSMISRKVDAINSWTLEEGAADAAYRRAVEAGIVIVGQSTASPYMSSTVWLQQNYGCSLAKMGAKYIADRRPGAKTLVIGGPPVKAITHYAQCFLDAAKAAGLTVLDKKDNMADTAAGSQPIAAAMVNQHPDVEAVWTYNDPTALGAGNALKAAGKQVWQEGKSDDGVIVIGSNGTEEGIQGIKSGLMTVTYDMHPDVIGTQIIAVLAKHFRDGVPAKDLPKNVVVPTTKWDLSNVADYVDPMKRPIKLGAVLGTGENSAGQGDHEITR
ncbi:sugar ABC transporter substrate-binding protein [Conexibacter woesei]|uniref:Periplasmic binding protein/LacI transcriptional regulator n=1 Tax=Conexibacter woesei (strain DSM 14684 / CCUG 47730 / CIP 108061 / JCM 11494 / NBRC 100937 / ID131577) TaxID=469383 RepID=D3F491_CONWI|nr:sugar ABC transporter substrate-binding protein [Conexibacter woesei]ADB50463.1 periplasmic binding protein/LacI transcriptional regulator [Conexibacter woesei DSM 14684]